MDALLTIIEEHDEDGATWGISTAGPNPPPEDFTPVKDKAEAVAIVQAYARGDYRPLLAAAMKPKD